MMTRTMMIWMCFVFACVCSSVTLYAEDVIQVVTENWAPYNFEENTVVKGISTDIVKKVLERTGLKYTISVYPWARAYNMALEEENILIYTIVRTPERENVFKWVRAIVEADSTNLYKLSEREDIAITTLEDAKKYTIGVIRESMYHQFLVKHGFIKIEPVASMGQNFQKLMDTRIDLWAEGEKNFLQEIKDRQAEYPDIKIEKAFYLFKYPYYMAFSKKTSDEIVNTVRDAFDQLVSEGVLKVYE